MKKCDNKKHIESSKGIFDRDEGLQELFVSTDGQFFLKPGSASHHCKVNDVSLTKITRDQTVKKEQPKEKPKEQPKEKEKAAPKEKPKAAPKAADKPKNTKKDG